MRVPSNLAYISAWLNQAVPSEKPDFLPASKYDYYEPVVNKLNLFNDEQIKQVFAIDGAVTLVGSRSNRASLFT